MKNKIIYDITLKIVGQRRIFFYSVQKVFIDGRWEVSLSVFSFTALLLWYAAESMEGISSIFALMGS